MQRFCHISVSSFLFKSLREIQFFRCSMKTKLSASDEQPSEVMWSSAFSVIFAHLVRWDLRSGWRGRLDAFKDVYECSASFIWFLFIFISPPIPLYYWSDWELTAWVEAEDFDHSQRREDIFRLIVAIVTDLWEAGSHTVDGTLKLVDIHVAALPTAKKIDRSATGMNKQF